MADEYTPPLTWADAIKEAAAVVQLAREGVVDNDFRAIISMIKSLEKPGDASKFLNDEF